ncbi:MAG: hypothetical protein OHK0046_28640 [Anaerolineae bacterium]
MIGRQTSHLAWVAGYTRRDDGVVPDTYTANYSVKDLMRKGYISLEEGQAFLDECHLQDFAWKIHWPEDFETPDEYLLDRVSNVQGYVVFVHGWTGNNTIWEELPGMIVQSNRRLVAISIDHNGFGFSKFTDDTPDLNLCNPPAAMNALQKWIDLIKLRRQPGDTQAKIINFVGHSMGGATLFYLNPMYWQYGEVTCYALAPALLLEDELHRAFFTALGLGINVVQRIRAFEFVERFVKPTVVRTLCAGASDYVKETHTFQYGVTPRGVTGSTFIAMGQLDNTEIARNWDLFRVMLGHRDRLVGLTGMMDLLVQLEFPAGHIRVVPGTHYMFSIGTESSLNSYQHAQNRELVVQDILALHELALKRQREGRLIG